MKLLFTRHGESEANVQMIISNRDLAHRLTEKGIGQAQKLAQELSGYAVRSIYCSPILRARETAEIVAAKLGLPFQVTPALREIDCGMIEGRGDAQAWQAHDAIIKAWDDEKDYDRYIPPDGESFNAVKARFLPLIDQLQQENGRFAGDILLIGHGSLFKLMLPLAVANIDRRFTMRHAIDNCRLIVCEVRDGGLFCSQWNSAAI